MLAGRAPVPGRCLPGRQPAIAGGCVPRNSECMTRACKLPQLCRLCWCTPERPPELHSAVLDDCPAPISAPVSFCATPAQMRARWRCLRTNSSALSCCAPATPSCRRPPALPRPAWRRSPAKQVLEIWLQQLRFRLRLAAAFFDAKDSMPKIVDTHQGVATGVWANQ